MLLRQREEKYSSLSLHPTFQSPPIPAIGLMLLTWEPGTLISSSCHNKYHKQCGLDNRNLPGPQPHMKLPPSG